MACVWVWNTHDGENKDAKNMTIYLRAYNWLGEIKQDSFICAKRLHIVNNLLYDSCSMYVKDVFSVNNFKNEDKIYGTEKYNKQYYNDMLNNYAGVIVEFKRNK